MGRKVRSGVLLVLILAIIYTQQSVIYAQNGTGRITKTAGDNANFETTDGENHEETEKPGGESGDKKDTGNSSGDGEKEDSGNSGESQDKEEPGNSDKEDGDKEEPEKHEIKKYTLEVPAADGKNGYYISKPTVKITHNGCYGTTIYEVKCGGQITVQGRLECEEEPEADGKNESGMKKMIRIVKSYMERQKSDDNLKKTGISLTPETFGEGTNFLHISMEDEEGNPVPEYDETMKILVDTQKPELVLGVPEGFNNWYQKETRIAVTSDDGASGSQIDTVLCYAGNKVVGTSDQNKSEFLITQTSSDGEGVPVRVTVTDRAGNSVERTAQLFIDSLAPTVSMNGAADYQITSQPVTLEYQVTDDNKLESCQAVIEYEVPEGEKKTEVISSENQWNFSSTSGRLAKTFQEDGIYKTSVQAVDKASQKTEQNLQFIIDTKNPVIKMVDELQGKYLKKFSWDYPIDVFIKDFTTFVHQIQMDGRLYPIGTEIDTEGRHTLQVNAVDAAGNEAVATAEFVIDHTPPKIQFHQVEEGKQYEGIVRFQIDSEKKEDRIEEVLINGKRQTIKKEKGKYLFQITDPGEYEVNVKATDLAGNEAQENLSFEVVPEKTILEKAAEPIKKILFGITENEPENQQKQIENRQFAMLKWIVIGSIITILLIVIDVAWYMHKKGNTKEKQIGEE